MINRRELEIGNNKAKKRTQYYIKECSDPTYQLGLHRKLTKTCSGPCCGNQRHNEWLKEHDKLTMQEKKANDSFEEDIKNLE